MPASIHDTIGHIVDTIVRRRQRRVVRAVGGWWCDPEDWRQEAWVEALEGLRRSQWGSNRGTGTEVLDSESFVARIADLAISHYQVEMGSPVSETTGCRKNLIGIQTADPSDNLPAEGHTADAGLEREARADRVAAILADMAAEDPGLRPALAVMLHGATRKEAAELYGVDVEEVSRARAKLIRAVKASDQLLRLGTLR